jgi:hypothetical protein
MIGHPKCGNSRGLADVSMGVGQDGDGRYRYFINTHCDTCGDHHYVSDDSWPTGEEAEAEMEAKAAVLELEGYIEPWSE